MLVSVIVQGGRDGGGDVQARRCEDGHGGIGGADEELDLGAAEYRSLRAGLHQATDHVAEDLAGLVADDAEATTDSLGPMGQVTDWITEYHEGDGGADEFDLLVTRLRGFDFKTPARFADIPEDLYEAEAQAEDRTYEDVDTMDEVYAAKARGLLSSDEVVEITEALEGARG
ncbi:hypothetical protein BH20ACT2_BH20ACT2_15480 [soil metagenome]